VCLLLAFSLPRAFLRQPITVANNFAWATNRTNIHGQRGGTGDYLQHRHLRKVDCSTNASLSNIHINKTRVLVAGTKQKQILGSPDCPLSLLALQSVFTVTNNSINQTNMAGSVCHKASIYDVYYLKRCL